MGTSNDDTAKPRRPGLVTPLTYAHRQRRHHFSTFYQSEVTQCSVSPKKENDFFFSLSLFVCVSCCGLTEWRLSTASAVFSSYLCVRARARVFGDLVSST